MKFVYEKQNQEAREFVATIDLRSVVAIRGSEDSDVVTVQMVPGGTYHLPYDAQSLEALKRDFANCHGGLVVVYQFTDVDRDDAVTWLASFRLDAMVALQRMRQDPSCVLLRTTAKRAMVLPYKRVAVAAITEAWGNLRSH